MPRRIKFIKSVGQYRQGQVAYVTPNEAHGFIDAGFAVISKDMVEGDMRTKVPLKRLNKAQKGRK